MKRGSDKGRGGGSKGEKRERQRERGREEKVQCKLMATDLGCSCNKRTLNNQ